MNLKIIRRVIKKSYIGKCHILMMSCRFHGFFLAVVHKKILHGNYRLPAEMFVS